MKRGVSQLVYSVPFWGVVVGVAVGSVDLPGGLWDSLIHAGVGRDILIDIRLPRVLLAGTVGALLASAGCALQGLLRNPLADPYLLGVSGGASLGSAIGLLLGVAQPPAAMAGALLALGAVLIFSRGGGAPSATLMVLAGAALHALTSSILTLILSQARREESAGILFWLLGSLESPSYGRLLPLLALALLVFGGLWALAPSLNLLSLGDDSARALGLSTEKVRWAAVLLAAGATGLAVTFNGVIPFVGLVVPHAARLLAGHDNRKVLPVSASLGAGLLMGADALGRSVMAPQEIPVGVVTALVGAPFFLLLLRRERKKLG
ncbi:MAG: iron ABC transporter permease [Elusimicrobia bacterium]|nr:iron ABC transporter permease [Elusimicrobiota bacterium]